MRRYIFSLLLVACAGACSRNSKPSETAADTRDSRDESHVYGSNDSTLPADERTSEMPSPQHRTRDEMATAGDRLPDSTRPTNPATTPPSPSTSNPAGPSVSTPPTGGLAPTKPNAPVGSDAMGPDATRTPDNTEVNERDRGGATLTPMDQSEKDSDVRITQEIRRAIVDTDALSFSSKNVKIITRSGKVTLRGTVPSARERSLIEDAAKARAGVTSVDNQIEISKK